MEASNPRPQEPAEPEYFYEHFNKLATRWINETALISNMHRAAQHPAYREIIAMGEPAIPLILWRLRYLGGHWYFALQAISGVNPTPPGGRGHVPTMREAWLQWGAEKGYIDLN